MTLCELSPSSRRAWIEIRLAGSPRRLGESPSSRRAWIEIERLRRGCPLWTVALLAEGVDRNTGDKTGNLTMHWSPSSRRAWIEIFRLGPALSECRPSPSSRRAWIEISGRCFAKAYSASRPPRGGRG